MYVRCKARSNVMYARRARPGAPFWSAKPEPGLRQSNQSLVVECLFQDYIIVRREGQVGSEREREDEYTFTHVCVRASILYPSIINPASLRRDRALAEGEPCRGVRCAELLAMHCDVAVMTGGAALCLAAVMTAVIDSHDDDEVRDPWRTADGVRRVKAVCVCIQGAANKIGSWKLSSEKREYARPSAQPVGSASDR
ncbi:hypothetical protein K437DRAFT_106517 [Tilletiaria anomala UBC 951]|uniref:Uncharacterized protein n=1 Tax=Tilletiaria anomala (strain ATCC 24038 / CBS 436.72 / UBC 951) TaxID=1037660 RepID=A0A066W251_TILAU|nr:uncharacterized protein K437DRAFT_106517 [Tilletiaria anomala UBC 951]KDN46638.1 hypothetical protein K437DRAFT_106517 [Tilletiaria anomala UBC 951]